VLTGYLPVPLSDTEVAALVAATIGDVAAGTGALVTMRQMGSVIKQVQAAAAGRADGGRISAAVRAALAG